jgi:dTDP-4-dehydrorhamnose 3,5-epimerase
MSVIPFEARTTEIRGLFVVEMKQIEDERGVVREFFRASDFGGPILPEVGPWAQVNVTATDQGAIRGLHGEEMNKFVSVASGEAYGAYLDARPDSPTFGLVVTIDLRPGVGVLVGEGICNGFQAVAPGVTQYLYCFDREWSATMPGIGVSPIDPDLAIAWPIPIDPDDRSVLSAKDAALPRFRDL